MKYQKTLENGDVVTQEASDEGHIHILMREGFTLVEQKKAGTRKVQAAEEPQSAVKEPVLVSADDSEG